MRDRIEACRSDALTWQDLGAQGPNAFASRCRRDWDAASAAMNSRELGQALDICTDALDDVATMDCATVIALYAPLD